jgi:asparagine synthetase B (glutamine-hydrolysing)
MGADRARGAAGDDVSHCQLDQGQYLMPNVMKHTRLRELSIEAMRRHEDDVLLLSGGVDSASMLGAALACGYKPRIFTFRLDGYISPDFQVAESMARTFGCEFHPVLIPMDVDRLAADVRKIIGIAGSRLKTHVQCAHPFLYLCEQAQRIGAKRFVYCGAGSDLYGDGRKAMIAYHNGGDEAYRKIRAHATDPDVWGSSLSIIKVCDSYGMSIYDPYLLPNVIEFFLSLTHDEMHHPKQKYIGLLAFPEIWSRGAWYRESSNFQINSRLREFHDTLLQSKYNTGDHKSVVGIYNRMTNEKG